MSENADQNNSEYGHSSRSISLGFEFLLDTSLHPPP